MEYNEFCLINYYAVELLESADGGLPTQKEIDAIEELLIDDKVKADHAMLQKLIIYDFPEQKALLIEKEPLLQKVHYVLISNMGFHVDIASSKEDVIAFAKNHYDIVFTRPYHEDFSGVLSTKLFMFDKLKSKIILYITPEEREMTDYFSQQGADAILEIPLNSNLLYDVLAGKNNNSSF